MADEVAGGIEPPSPVVVDGEYKRVLIDPERKMEVKFVIDMDQLAINSVIHDGLKSTVFGARYKGSQVAAKKVLLEGDSPTMDREIIQIFDREISIYSQVEHKHVVKFVGASVADMTIVTEYMAGGSLKNHLIKNYPNRLDLQTAIKFALDIARAMEYLHANDIMHRNLNPTNLLLTEDKKLLKVADFTSARNLEPEEKKTTEVGTYKWMAPEVHGGPDDRSLKRGEKKYYTYKVDVHGFAMVLWELITNEAPFKGMGFIEAAYAIAMDKRPSLDDIPEGLRSFLESCWANNAAKRPEFTDIVTFLSDFLGALQHDEQALPLPQNDGIRDTLLAGQGSSSKNVAADDEYSDEDERKRSTKSSANFFSCLEKCFPTCRS